MSTATNLYKAIMNRFRTKKKARDTEDAPAPAPSLPSSKWGRKSKKGPTEQKPETDFTIALPSNDEFRTSLLMPNLSARFSMLREQDDPNSILGKASDDSVLQPKRQSRLLAFGGRPGGLTDIAEVASISSSIQRPFASGRQDSFGSGDWYGTDDENASPGGSIMGRSRAGEGNVLFGGRQRVYRIPMSAASSKSLGSSSARPLGGKEVYEDDINMSAYQKLRQAERERQRLASGEHGLTFEQDLDSPRKNSFQSHSLSDYNQKRGTSSSTTSGPSMTRSSTAATSIASQGANSVAASGVSAHPSGPPPIATAQLDRSTTKARRLYEQGLDQNIQDQQSSVMSRLKSIQRQRTLNGKAAPPLSQVKSTSNLPDRYATRRTPPFRAVSPPPSAPLANAGTFTLAKDIHSSSPSSFQGLQQSPPMSPFVSEGEESGALSSAIQPNDRGKATAMGAFNRPRAFDEQQYLQRQKQMQQGRETPPPRKDSPATSDRDESLGSERHEADTTASMVTRSTDASPEKLPSNVSATHYTGVKQAAKAQLTGKPRSAEPDKERTFFASPDTSDSEYDERDGLQSLPPQATSFPPIETERSPTETAHVSSPAFADLTRPSLEQRPTDPSASYIETIRRPTLVSEKEPADSTEAKVKSDGRDIDSPTLGPDNGGLSGLVRQHLRNASTQSSVYASSIAPSVSLPSRDGPRSGYSTFESDNIRITSTYSHSNPWDLEELDDTYSGEVESLKSASPADSNQSRTTPISTPFANSRMPLAQATPSDILHAEVPEWQRELRKHHIRGGSTETQDEREAFANEIAQRQRAIQESVRSKSRSGSRSASPAPGVPGHMRAFGMLRSKSSRDSMASKVDAPPKALKMLGLTGSSTNVSSASLSGNSERSFGREQPRLDEDRYFGNGAGGPVHYPMDRRARKPSESSSAKDAVPSVHRPSADTTRDPRQQRPSAPSSTRSSVRNRSSSEASGRSQSRAGRYREHAENAMPDGFNGVPLMEHARSGFRNLPRSPKPSGDETQLTSPPWADPVSSNAPSTRARSNSRSAATPGYFDQRTLHPIHTGNSTIGSMSRFSPSANSGISPGASPRPSPGLPSPSGASFRPSPAMPYSAHSTPPMSGSTTPVSSVFSSSSSAPPRTGAPRKRSIQKSDISEPTLISQTSVMDTRELPPGASLRNGQDEAPPVPPINPRRRRFGFGRQGYQESTRSPHATSPPEPMSTFSADEDDKPRNRRLRKTSSEGRSLHGQAKQQATSASPALPNGANYNITHRRPVADGVMF